MTNPIKLFSQEWLCWTDFFFQGENAKILIWHKINSSTAGKQSDMKSFAVLNLIILDDRSLKNVKNFHPRPVENSNSSRQQSLIPLRKQNC